MQPGGLTPPLSPWLFFFSSFLRPRPLLRLFQSALTSCLGSTVFTAVGDKQAAGGWFGVDFLTSDAPDLSPLPPTHPHPSPPGYVLVCSSHEGRSTTALKDNHSGCSSGCVFANLGLAWNSTTPPQVRVSEGY